MKLSDHDIESWCANNTNCNNEQSCSYCAFRGGAQHLLNYMEEQNEARTQLRQIGSLYLTAEKWAQIRKEVFGEK